MRSDFPPSHRNWQQIPPPSQTMIPPGRRIQVSTGSFSPSLTHQFHSQFHSHRGIPRQSFSYIPIDKDPSRKDPSGKGTYPYRNAVTTELTHSHLADRYRTAGLPNSATTHSRAETDRRSLLTRQLMQSMHSIPLLDVRCFSFK